MKLASTALVLVFTLPTFGTAQESKSPLTGSWVMGVAHGSGVEIKDPLIRWDLVFDGDGVVLNYDENGRGGPKNTAKGKYTIEAKATPTRIVFKDLKPVEGSPSLPTGFPMVLIYKLEGEKLTLCYDKGGNVPDKFETKKDDKREIVEFNKRKQ